MKNLKTVSTITSTALSTLLFMAMPAAHADDTQAGGWTGNISGYVGHKSVDDDDWPNLNSQRSAGVISDFRKQSWPVSIAADLISAAEVHEDGANEDTGGTMELHLGARKIFTLENTSFRPYVGGGLAIISASLENENAGVTVDDEDTAFGAWIGAGTYYAVTPSFNLGMDVRYTKAEVTLFDQDREAGGLNVGITAGYHW
ncbi:MAG: outer membrane protein [Arenicellales bacterium]